MPKLSESDLCASFIRWAADAGWVAYAETGGWDILLVRGEVQLGVQAKLNFNARLLAQALPERPWGATQIGPEYRGVLVPRWDRDAQQVCGFCGLIHFCFGRSKGHRVDGDGGFDATFIPSLDPENWDVWPADKSVALPDYVPDVRAGSASPVRLTKWKVGALKICALLELRGHVTTADFRRFGIDQRRWVAGAWVVPMHLNRGKYIRGHELAFDKQHPIVYAQILAELKAGEVTGVS